MSENVTTFTVTDIMDLGPCSRYSRERVAALFAGREALTLARVLDLDIPAEDRIWAVTRLLPPREARLFACDVAERALEREREAGREPHPDSWRAVEVARRYARGEAREEELEAAQKDAAQAVRSASAPWSAYWAAAGAAYWAAYWSAADAADAADAAYRAADAADAADAAYRAAGAAAGAAEREWQVERLRFYAGKENE